MRVKWTVLFYVSSLVLTTSLIFSTPARAWQKKDAKKGKPEATRSQYYKKWLRGGCPLHHYRRREEGFQGPDDGRRKGKIHRAVLVPPRPRSANWG